MNTAVPPALGNVNLREVADSTSCSSRNYGSSPKNEPKG